MSMESKSKLPEVVQAAFILDLALIWIEGTNSSILQISLPLGGNHLMQVAILAVPSIIVCEAYNCLIRWFRN